MNYSLQFLIFFGSGLHNIPVFWLLSSSACIALRSFISNSALMFRRDTAETMPQAAWGYTLPYNYTLSNKYQGELSFKVAIAQGLVGDWSDFGMW